MSWHRLVADNGEKMAGRVWGWLLVLMGCGVVFRVHQLAPQIDQIAGSQPKAFFIRICIYIMAILLVGGGIKKIRTQYDRTRDKPRDR
ncbi:MAG: hypothetical protein B5M56_04950 [Desulfococcus sp. 4484_241]|nr:MAG: hypothetical protein B5M56_04950 [Desulfococcus sp. 4484_241]